MEFEKVIAGIEKNATAAVGRDPGDYINEADGLLYCGKCNTPKQCRVTLFGEERKQSCLCDCETAKRDGEIEERIRKAERRKIDKMRTAGFPLADMQDWVFAADDGKSPELINTARLYAEQFSTMLSRKKGLLLYGTVGTGKTFAAACIVNALIDEGVPCMLTNFARLTNTINGMYEGKQQYIDSLSDYKLLVIDDLSIERDTAFMNEMVYNIIDSRYRSGLPLIITTNLTGSELKKPDTLAKQRLYSRLYEMCIPVEVKGQDRRAQKLKNEIAEFQNMLGL